MQGKAEHSKDSSTEICDLNGNGATGRTISDIRIAVVGLGYVGLPLALAFARKFPGTVGFDINSARIEALKRGEDVTDEGFEEQISATSLTVGSTPDIMRGSNFFIVGVPTPVDENHNPDLEPLKGACASVGSVLQSGSTVVFESTVYPGVTEDVCGPLLEKASGLRAGKDFFLGYSPERINPGDREHTLERIVKVVSGDSLQTLDRVAQVYASIIEAGVHRAPSIKVAEAAKVIENTQRDLNIALMNELSLIFDRMGIRTRDVLDAAGTKWNFLKFSPGLVGGHCIGVDPYYLTTKAEQLGYHPQVILAGRRINDEMGIYVGQRLVKLMINSEIPIKGARVAVLGLTFKENVADIRNSRVPDIIRELRQFGVQPLVVDPHANSSSVHEEYGIELADISAVQDFDALIIAVAHREYKVLGATELRKMVRSGGVIADVRSVLDCSSIPEGVSYWSL